MSIDPVDREVSSINLNAVRRGCGGTFDPVVMETISSGSTLVQEMLPDPNFFGVGRPMAVGFNNVRNLLENLPTGSMEFRIATDRDSGSYLSAKVTTFTTSLNYFQTFSVWLDEFALTVPGTLAAWRAYPTGSRIYGYDYNYNLQNADGAATSANWNTSQANTRYFNARIEVKDETGSVVWDRYFYPENLNWKFGVYQKDKNSSATAFFGSTNLMDTWGHSFSTNLDFCLKGPTPQACFTLVRDRTSETIETRSYGPDQNGRFRPPGAERTNLYSDDAWSDEDIRSFYLQTVSNEIHGFVGTDLKSIIGNAGLSNMAKFANGPLGWEYHSLPGIPRHSNNSTRDIFPTGGNYPFSQAPLHGAIWHRYGTIGAHNFRQPSNTDEYDQRKAMAADTAIPTSTGNSHAPVLGDDDFSASTLNFKWVCNNDNMLRDLGTSRGDSSDSSGAVGSASTMNFLPVFFNGTGGTVQINSLGEAGFQESIIYRETVIGTTGQRDHFPDHGNFAEADIEIKLPTNPTIGETHFIKSNIKMPSPYKMFVTASHPIQNGTNGLSYYMYQYNSAGWSQVFRPASYDPYRDYYANREFVATTSNPLGQLAQGYYHGANDTEELFAETDWRRGNEIVFRGYGNARGGAVIAPHPSQHHGFWNFPSDIKEQIEGFAYPQPGDDNFPDPTAQGFVVDVPITMPPRERNWQYTEGSGLPEYFYDDPFTIPVHFHCQAERKVFVEKTKIEAKVERIQSSENLRTSNAIDKSFHKVTYNLVKPADGSVEAEKVSSGTYDGINQPFDSPRSQDHFAVQDTCKLHGLMTVWVREELHNVKWVSNFFQLWHYMNAMSSPDVDEETGEITDKIWSPHRRMHQIMPGKYYTRYEEKAHYHSLCLIEPPYTHDVHKTLPDMTDPPSEENNWYGCGGYPDAEDLSLTRIRAMLVAVSKLNPTNGATQISGDGGLLTDGAHRLINPPDLESSNILMYSARKLQMNFCVHLGPEKTGQLRNGGTVSVPLITDYSDAPGWSSTDHTAWFDKGSLEPAIDRFVLSFSDSSHSRDLYTGFTGVSGNATFNTLNDQTIRLDRFSQAGDTSGRHFSSANDFPRTHADFQSVPALSASELFPSSTIEISLG